MLCIFSWFEQHIVKWNILKVFVLQSHLIQLKLSKLFETLMLQDISYENGENKIIP